MKLNYLYTILVLGSLAFPTFAQDPSLTKEITIETDFVPIEQKVTKPGTLPYVIKSKVEQKDLLYSNWSSASELPVFINKFEPYRLDGNHNVSKSKGYADLGIGSQLNIVGSAGYRIIDNQEMTLKTWLQHSSTWAGKNSSPLAGETPKTQKFNDNVLAVDFSNAFSKGTLIANAYYHLDHFNYYGAEPVSSSKEDFDQTANEIGMHIGWNGNNKKIQYTGELSYNHFGYSKSTRDIDDGLNENNLRLKAFVEAPINSLFIGINASVNYLKYSEIISLHDTDWFAMFKASPYVRYSGNRFQLSGGLNFDFSANDGAKIRFSPNVKASYIFDDKFSVYTNIIGGKRINSLSNYHALCRYLAPSTPIGTSYTPFNGEVGVKIGPVSGFHIKPFFAYGSFKNEKLLVNGESAIYATLGSYDIKGWKAGVELGLKYNELAEFSAIVEYAPQDNDKGYLTGLDRAETILTASVKVIPIKSLSVTLEYEMRNNRNYYTPSASLYDNEFSWTKTKLNNVNNLSLNTYYQVNQTIGVFVNVSNLLNKQWDIFYGMGAQKINALAGANIVF